MTKKAKEFAREALKLKSSSMIKVTKQSSESGDNPTTSEDPQTPTLYTKTNDDTQGDIKT